MEKAMEKAMDKVIDEIAESKIFDKETFERALTILAIVEKLQEDPLAADIMHIFCKDEELKQKMLERL